MNFDFLLEWPGGHLTSRHQIVHMGLNVKQLGFFRSKHMILGIDVSHWQGNVNMDKVARYGAKFMIAKASEIYLGKIHKDDKYIQNINNAKRAGLITGAYHFFRPSSPLTAQVRLFKEMWNKAPADLPPVIDAEAADKLTAGQVKNAFEHFYKGVRDTFGREPIIYSRDGLIKAWGLLDYIADPSRYWKALYSSKFSGYPCAIWQFSETFRIPGISTNMDGNYFMGSAEDLQKLVGDGVGVPTTPEPEPFEYPKNGVVVASSLNVRVEPDHESRAIGVLRKGAKINIIGIENERWAALDRGGYCALYGAAGVFVKIE